MGHIIARHSSYGEHRYGARGVEIYGRLNNFLNQKYEEAFGFPSLHLNFMAGIRFTFPAE